MVKRILYLCFLPLVVGGFIYVLFRKNGLLGIALPVPGFKSASSGKVLIDVLPDFCWAFSLSSALYLFFNSHNFSFKKTAWLIGFIIVFSELVQLLIPAYFTFDMLDLLAAFLAFIFSSVIAKSQYENTV